MKLTQMLITALMVNALVVFVGLCLGRNMGLFIAGYWLILTAKNYADWRRTR